MQTLHEKFEHINEFLKNSEYDAALKHLEELPSDAKNHFRFTALLCRYYMTTYKYEQVLETLKTKEFNNFHYYLLWSNYYYALNNPQEMEHSIEKMISFTPPENIKIQQLENLEVLKKNFLQAAHYAEELFKLNPDNINPLRRVLHYLSQEKKHKQFLEKLDFILMQNSDFTFSQDQLIDSLYASYDDTQTLQYLLQHAADYPNNKSIMSALTETIHYLNPQFIKNILTADDKNTLLHLPLSAKIKSFLTENYEPLQTTNTNTEIENNLEFKRSVLTSHDLADASSVITSPVSTNAKGTVIVFSGLAMQAMMPLETLDKYFSALNLNAIYLFDLKKLFI